MTGIARSFDAVPDLYDEVRPTYPTEVYDAIDAAVGGLTGCDVLDLAAGTGIVFRELIERGASAAAVEPSELMLGRLVARSPGARAVAGNGESIPFRDESFDVVICSTAWHWLRAEPAVAEVRRILRPGGYLVLVWANNEFGDGIEWEDAQSAVFDSWGSIRGSVPPSHDGVGPRDAAADLRDRGVDVIVERLLRWQRTVPREVHVQMLRTHSNNLILSESDREELIGQIEVALAPWPTITERLWGPLIIARF